MFLESLCKEGTITIDLEGFFLDAAISSPEFVAFCFGW
jgi:hypothetical protein